MSSAVVGGATGVTLALWFYSRRYIGELALLMPEADVVCISTLDFWGDREDFYASVSLVKPPMERMSRAQIARASRRTFTPLEVDGDRQFLLSLPMGKIHAEHKPLLTALLTGELAKEGPPARAKASEDAEGKAGAPSRGP